ncbi:putative nucleic acid binding protein [Toxoplasma gondii ARI]|uniref:Putative nucleic acid binding protein n=1 Tax=Toxoplasma gondii ARI TaxID=1074872 RepID=A0A139YAU0_TOXGO|nr:putative nucleic acid binding protein [Toxoplasma gondii ARI]
MPASAGRVPMPEGNRVSVSSSLRTHAIWRDSVKYDPYAPASERGESKSKLIHLDELQLKARELFMLARLSGSIAPRVPGACRICHEVGHLPHQCRNMITISDRSEEAVATQEAAVKVLVENDEKKLCESLGIAYEAASDDGAHATGSLSETPSREGHSGPSSSSLFWYNPLAYCDSHRSPDSKKGQKKRRRDDRHVKRKDLKKRKHHHKDKKK